jgi:hypothetical protein
MELHDEDRTIAKAAAHSIRHVRDDRVQ